MTVERLNPEGLFVSPAFAQGTAARGSRTVYVGGQNGIDADGVVAEGLGPQGFAASQRVWTGAPTAITVVFVAGLGVPGALVEIDAIAVVD